MEGRKQITNVDFFGYISELLGIPIFIPIIIFAILILGLMGFIFIVYTKISKINPVNEKEKEKDKKK